MACWLAGQLHLVVARSFQRVEIRHTREAHGLAINNDNETLRTMDSTTIDNRRRTIGLSPASLG
jgi:hypothetical protein